MTGFVALAAGMTIVALAWVLLPLLRRRAAQDGYAVQASNLAILRDQLGELDADLASGTISSAQHARARAELERRAIEEGEAAGAKAAVGGASRLSAIAIAVLIPAGAVSLYLWTGEPAGLRPAGSVAAGPVTPEQVEDMVAQLAARLEKNPDDARGWAVLARSYYVMQRMPEAVAAYARAVAKITDDARLYADYADAMAMDRGRSIDGRVLEVVEKALAIDPAQPKALAMAGSAAFYRKDFAAALKYWETLLPMLPPDSEMAKSLVEGIAEAKTQLGSKAAVGANPPAQAGKPAAPSANAGVSGRVTLSPALKDRVSPEDTLFIYARAATGPRIPLAVLKKRAADLPVAFTLDDALAMRPELKISGVAEVIVSARISKSGNAIAQSGDLQGASGVVKRGAEGIAIVIDGVVP